MTYKHTPGPWHLGALPPSSELYICDNDGGTVAAVAEWEPNGQIHMIYKNSEANARLIAAAPDTAAERDKLHEDCGALKNALSQSYEKQESLEAINAELVETLVTAEMWLMRITDEMLDGEGSRPDYVVFCDIIRAAISKAKESAS